MISIWDYGILGVLLRRMDVYRVVCSRALYQVNDNLLNAEHVSGSEYAANDIGCNGQVYNNTSTL